MSSRVTKRNAHVLFIGGLHLAAALIALLASSSVFAADLTWGGEYRIEGTKIQNPELSGANSNKAYILHHLILNPKIIAADGVTVNSRIDVFNSPSFGINNGLVNSVAGDVIGNGPSTPATPGSSNTMGRTQRAGDFALTSLYATWSQEFGQAVVGRTPMQFGLGLAYNAGNGLFDHYLDTKDIVGYKMILGNLSFFPILAKVNEGVLGEEDDVNDYIFQVQYENPETNLALGLLYQMRVFTFAGNDTPLSGQIGGTYTGTPSTLTGLPTRADGGKSNLIGLFLKRRAGNFNIGIEANTMSGDTGVKTSANSGVSLNSFGIAGEFMYAPEAARFTGGVKIGMATGDDPGTPETYEGYTFSRNYDVAMLMFNHPLGSGDFLRTGLTRDTTTPVNRQIDSEAISNVFYISPTLNHQWKENLSYGGSLTYAMLNKEPFAGGNTAKDLGFELDMNVTYKPYSRLSWVTEAGFLFPGQAWSGGSKNFENKFAYGLNTKAAITF